MNSFEKRFGRFGFFKASIAAFPLLLASMVAAHADPISGTILISLAVSAAYAAASIGLQMLFQPKVKPVDKNKLQGDLQLTSVGEDIPILEQYGASLGDGIGGIRTGGNIIYASQIRKTEVITPGQSNGGGKGAPKSPPNREFHYYIDVAILVGRGPLRVKQVKANTDIIYQDFTRTNDLTGTTYEAESPTSHSSGWSAGADSDFSGLQKGSLPHNDWLEWNTVTGGTSTDPREIYIVYKSSQDVDIEFTLNGTVQRAVLPDSHGLVANVNLPNVLPSGSNTIRITNVTTGYTLALDRIVVGFDTIYIDPDIGGDHCYLSGVRYAGWTNPEPTYTYQGLRDPLTPDSRGCEQYNYQANPTTHGDVSTYLPGNGNLRWYPGNTTQLPDPMLQAHFESLYGAGATPAFRNRCYVVLENFELTKYGSMPNFTFLVEHETINSVGELFASRAARAGLQPSEYDFTDLEAVPLRGMAITEKSPPAKEMALLCRVYDIDVFEDFDGVIRGVIPNETVDAAIPVEDLAAIEGGENTENKPFAPVVTEFQDERDLPFFFDVSFFNPAKDWNTSNVHSLREIDVSDRKENIETGIVFTEAEAQKFADRELHKIYVEKDGLSVQTFHKYTYLTPTNLISVEDADGSVNQLRVKAIDGWLPGALEIKGVSRDALEFPPRLFVTAATNPVVASVKPPAPLVGTFIDLALFDEQSNPGFYVAASVTDPHYNWQGAGLYRLGQNSEWEALAGVRNRATMGRTVSGGGGINVALASAGSTVTGSQVSSSYPVSSVIDGVRHTNNAWGSGGGYNNSFAVSSGTPDLVTIDFGASRTIDRIGVITLADSENYNSDPVKGVTTFTTWGITDYKLQQWNGSAWVDISGASVTGNNLVWREFAFTAITTTKIRLSVSAALNSNARVVEIEAYTPVVAGGVLGAVPDTYTGAAGDFDTTNAVTIDLFVDEDIASVTDAQVESDGANTFVIGSEVIQAATITRVGGYYSRFTLSRLKRRLNQTMDTGHAAGERAVMRSGAWVYVEQDAGLAGTNRTYKFVGAGGDLDSASSVDFDWEGRTRYIGSIFESVDNGVPQLGAAPSVYAENGYWLIQVQRPTANGYTAYICEVRVRKDSDDSLVRQWDIGDTVLTNILAQTFDCKVDYRWRNNYRIGGSEGWSDWSTVTTVVHTSVITPPDTSSGGGDDPRDFDPVCFVDDVEILMADWSVKAIQDVAEGDHVMAWRPQGRIVPARVAATMRNPVSEYRRLEVGDDLLGVTEQHPFCADWNVKRRVFELKQGDTVRVYDKGWNFAEIGGIAVVEGETFVNNFEVEVWHTYFVRGKGSKTWKAVYNRKANTVN